MKVIYFLKSQKGAISLMLTLLILTGILVIALSVTTLRTERIKFTRQSSSAIEAKQAALDTRNEILLDIQLNGQGVISNYYDPGVLGDCQAGIWDTAPSGNYKYCLIDKGIIDNPNPLKSSQVQTYEVRARLLNSDVIQKVDFSISVLFALETKLKASDAESSDYFGESIAISGDTIVVGVKYEDDIASNSGAAYVFERSGSSWNEVAKLKASDAGSSDYFGESVAISGDTIVVGAIRDDDDNFDSGAAYVFEKNGDWGQGCGGTPFTCNETQKLKASDAGAGDELGSSVAISGDTIVAGAHLDGFTGSAYVFEYSGGEWGDCPGGPTSVCTEAQKLKASDAGSNDDFGGSVAISGDTIVVGAGYEEEIASDSGAAYVFEKNGDWGTSCSGGTPNTCYQNQKLKASDAGFDDYFGSSVAISGDTIVVGAPWEDDIVAESGAAYVFEYSGGEWGDCPGGPTSVCTEAQKLKASDAGSADFFGDSVAISGDTIVVGSSDDDIATNSGAAYVFEKNGDWGTSCSGGTPNTCYQNQKLKASDAGFDDYFGSSVAISGDTIVVGAPWEDDIVAESGAAHVFE